MVFFYDFWLLQLAQAKYTPGCFGEWYEFVRFSKINILLNHTTCLIHPGYIWRDTMFGLLQRHGEFLILLRVRSLAIPTLSGWLNTVVHNKGFSKWVCLAGSLAHAYLHTVLTAICSGQFIQGTRHVLYKFENEINDFRNFNKTCEVVFSQNFMSSETEIHCICIFKFYFYYRRLFYVFFGFPYTKNPHIDSIYIKYKTTTFYYPLSIMVK